MKKSSPGSKPAQKTVYKRVLLKLSGEALMGDLSYGISPETVKRIAKEISEVVKLGVEEFIGRWLEHIPERGLHTVRAYGLYASALKEKREACRAEIVAAGGEELASEPSQDQAGPTRVEHCPVCHRSLVIEEHRPEKPQIAWDGSVLWITRLARRGTVM